MNPEGYRKALRVFREAEKFGFPIITFIDTQGAAPGIGAEERGQAEAIAYNLKVMSGLRVPIICIIIGEGGSGGALGIGVGDQMLMLETPTIRSSLRKAARPFSGRNSRPFSRPPKTSTSGPPISSSSGSSTRSSRNRREAPTSILIRPSKTPTRSFTRL